ncbi:venom allergen 5-like, partial [Pollicipes pollicipes]|uniref:venom allergen 5-like n=1 Tax=Pollicipes pollicipes TaxID=41117 RepID=UPI0018858108
FCRYGGPDPTRCGTIVHSGLSQQERRDVVRMHNELRSRVAMGRELQGAPGPQPAAANMHMVEWDDELAAVAQRWAEQCTLQHDCGQCRRVPRFFVGQNLFASISSSGGPGPSPAEWNHAIEAWYEEVKDFASFDVDQFPSTQVVIGHYTAMVWGDTRRVGCGFVNYRTVGRDNRIYVCNYGPGGNILSFPVYERGSPCSACPAGTSCSLTYRGLCAADDGLNGMEMPSVMPPGAGPPAAMPPATMPPLTMPPMPSPGQGGAPGSGTSMPGSAAPPMDVFVVKPDPATGCFSFTGYVFCGNSKESLVVIEVPDSA